MTTATEATGTQAPDTDTAQNAAQGRPTVAIGKLTEIARAVLKNKTGLNNKQFVGVEKYLTEITQDLGIDFNGLYSSDATAIALAIKKSGMNGNPVAVPLTLGGIKIPNVSQAELNNPHYQKVIAATILGACVERSDTADRTKIEAIGRIDNLVKDTIAESGLRANQTDYWQKLYNHCASEKVVAKASSPLFHNNTANTVARVAIGAFSFSALVASVKNIFNGQQVWKNLGILAISALGVYSTYNNHGLKETWANGEKAVRQVFGKFTEAEVRKSSVMLRNPAPAMTP